MWNLFLGGLQLANNERKIAKGYISIALVHFLALIVGQMCVQLVARHTLNPVNAYFGLFWLFVGAVLIWVFCGPVGDYLLGRYATSDDKFSKAIVRVLIGFFTVENFVNVCFCIVPFYAHPGAFSLLLVSVSCYFMFRHMAGQQINWANWVRPVMSTIAYGLIIILIVANSDDASSTGVPSISISDWDYSTWMMIGIGLIVASFVLKDDKGEKSASQTKGGNNAG